MMYCFDLTLQSLRLVVFDPELCSRSIISLSGDGDGDEDGDGDGDRDGDGDEDGDGDRDGDGDDRT